MIAAGWIARVSAAFAVVLLPAGSTPAAAWGCEGHQAVAVLAERLLDARTRDAVHALLAGNPSDAAIERVCDAVLDHPMAHASTWADDSRVVDPSTAGWHFLNIPRSAGAGPQLPPLLRERRVHRRGNRA